MTSGDAGVVSRWLVVPRPSLQTVLPVSSKASGSELDTARPSSYYCSRGGRKFDWWRVCFLPVDWLFPLLSSLCIDTYQCLLL